LSEITFGDAASFCEEAEPEDVQLDYKLELPPKNLAKHFAAFSNTLGGLLIVGVEEDKQTGVPLRWEGVPNTGKLLERVHQFAADVGPRPKYEVRFTDEREGKAFLLIRVLEGDETPYYVANDANIYVRTGNISKPVYIASPDATYVLFGKQEKAKLARSNFARQALKVYEAAIKEAENERSALIAVERRQWEARVQGREDRGPFSSQYYTPVLGSQSAMLRIQLMPYFPSRALVTLQDVQTLVGQVHATSDDFRPMAGRPIPYGTLQFHWGKVNGEVWCQQLYANGLVFRGIDILRVDEKGTRRFHLGHVAVHLAWVLSLALNYFPALRYTGGIRGEINLIGVQGVEVVPIRPEGWWRDNSTVHPCLLDDHEWSLEFDTVLLQDKVAVREFFLRKLAEVYWALGFPSLSEPVVLGYLKQLRLPWVD
jgi:hypothetical protein